MTDSQPALELIDPDGAFAGRDIRWLLAHRAAQSGTDEFLVWVPRDGEVRRWTYAQFWHDVQAVACGLMAKGISAGDRLLIHSDNCPEMLISWYACATLGAIAVTTNTRCVGAELTYFAEHAGAIGAITTPELLPELQTNTPSIPWYIVIGEDWADLLQHGDTPPERATDPLLAAGIQYTSGTTARPKAVIHTHANVLWGGRTIADNMQITPTDAYLVNAPLFHTHAQGWNVWPMLWAGGRVVLQPKFSASTFWDVSLRHGATLASLQPFGIRALETQPVPEHSYRMFFFAARSRVLEQRFGAPIFSAWGMTETVSEGLRRELLVDTPEGSIGTAGAGYQIAIIDPATRQRVEPRQIGELYVRGTRGVQLTAGYYNNSEANAKAFTADGWFETGDQVWQDEEGFFYFADRDKDVLRVGGENVSARQVEALLTMHLGLENIHSLAVIASPHPMLSEVPVVFVKRLESTTVAENEMTAQIHRIAAKDLADFKRPRAVYYIDEMPTGLLDKINKVDLRRRAEAVAPAAGLVLPTID